MVVDEKDLRTGDCVRVSRPTGKLGHTEKGPWLQVSFKRQKKVKGK